MFAGGIDVVPEYKTAVGDVDFVFLGSIRGKGIAKFCMEFKLAHSDDVFDGLLSQLPAYMQSKSIERSAYCVMYFCGDWFDKPAYSLDELELELAKRYSASTNPLVKSTRTLIWDVTKPVTASKL